MLKKIYGLSALLFFASSLLVGASSTNKTFFMPTPPGREAFLDFAASYRVRRVADNPGSDRIGVSFHAIPFFRKSVKKDKLGSYFGAVNKPALTYGKSSIEPDRSRVDITSENLIHNPFEFKVKYNKNTNQLYLNPSVQPASSDPVGEAHVKWQDLIFYTSASTTNIPRVGGGSPGSGPFTFSTVRLNEYREGLDKFNSDFKSGPSGEFSLNPESSAYGVKLGLYLNLPNVGYLKINLPILRVENDLNINFVDDRTDVLARFLSGEYEKPYVALAATTVTYDDERSADAGGAPFFTTTYSVFKDPVAGSAGAQEALKNLKINFGKLKSNFGLGDLEVTLGSRIVDMPACDHGLFVNLVVPLSEEAKSEFLFEPLRGNGKHFEVGAGIEGTLDWFNWAGINVEAFYNIGMGYSFSAQETRTLDVFLDAKLQYPWQRYFLVAELGKPGALIPLANLTTLKVDVRPGLRMEGFVGLGLSAGEVSGDFGWGFLARETERVRLASDWPSKKYAVVNAADFRTYEALSLAKGSPHTFGTSNNTTIEVGELDLNSAATPAQFSQTIWGAITYTLPQKGYPLAFTLGGNYEFGNDAAVMTNWMVWLKASVAF